MTCGNSLSYGSIEKENNEVSRVYENFVEEEETKQERQSAETESSEQLLNPEFDRPKRNQILGKCLWDFPQTVRYLC